MLLMSKRPAKDKIATEQINVRLPSALLDKLDRLGEPLGIRRSHLIQQAIVEFVQRHEQQHQPNAKQHAGPR